MIDLLQMYYKMSTVLQLSDKVYHARVLLGLRRKLDESRTWVSLNSIKAG